MTETLITNTVTIAIALIAGLVALHQVKLNIISNSRVKWIENLREILSLYCSELENCSKAKLDLNDERKNKTGKELDDSLDKFYWPYANSATEVLKLQSKAFLYLNSRNTKHNRIEELMRKNSLLVHDMNTDNRKVIQKNIEEIITIAKDIFEMEWKKSKRLFKI